MSRHAKNSLGTVLRLIIHLTSCIIILCLILSIMVDNKAATHPFGLQRLFSQLYLAVAAKFTIVILESFNFTYVLCFDMLLSLRISSQPLISVGLTLNNDTILLCIYLLNLFIKLIVFLIYTELNFVRQLFIWYGGLGRIYYNTFFRHLIKNRNWTHITFINFL